MKRTEGSVTIFLTLLFLLLFSLVGAGLDSARFWGSRGYIATAAQGGNVAVFGNYNKELYQEYELFAYGGYNGLNGTDWLQEFEGILAENLKTYPEKKQGWQGIFQKNYSCIYQIQSLDSSLSQISYLTQEKEFLGQIDSWMQTVAFSELSSVLIEKAKGNQNEEPERILEELQDKKEVTVEEQESSGENESVSGNEADISVNETEENIESKEEITENPLTFFKELISHGVLRLVCEEEKLSKERIMDREETEIVQENLQEPEWCQEEDEINLLEGALEQSDSLWNQEMECSLEKKGKLLIYASRIFQNYLEQGEKHAAYGLEYLASGKEKEEDSMAYIVNRLFFIRSIINYAYVNQNPSFQKMSLATATEIAVLFGGEPFIPLIQQGILLILAMEEACVDVTALLQGRLVPFSKSAASFQMTFEEICLGSEALFQKKANAFPKGDKKQQLKGINQGFGYIHYLWLMMLMTSWEQLYSRTLDLIQDDLRYRFNESFEIEKCITGAKVEISYQMPILSSVFLEAGQKEGMGKEASQGLLQQKINMRYGYR